jgi:hypothetical protein
MTAGPPAGATHHGAGPRRGSAAAQGGAEGSDAPSLSVTVSGTSSAHDEDAITSAAHEEDVITPAAHDEDVTTSESAAHDAEVTVTGQLGTVCGRWRSRAGPGRGGLRSLAPMSRMPERTRMRRGRAAQRNLKCRRSAGQRPGGKT